MSTQRLPIVFLAFANEQEEGNAHLRALPREHRTLVRTIEQAQDAGKCQLVTKYNVTVGEIFDTFQKEQYRGRICLFHYGGHASSFQLLLESEAGGNQSAYAEPLIKFLSKQEGLRFVFLNGCSTEAQVQRLKEAGVPSIATSQSINDEVATEFAQRFYKGLSKDLTLGKCYEEAADYIKTFHGSGNARDLYWDGAEEQEVDGLPWQLHTLKGKESLLEWSLAKERISGDWVGRVTGLISKNKLKEAISLAEKNLKGQGDLYEDVVNLQRKLKRVAREERNGLLSFGEAGREYNKITYSLLGLLGESREE